LEGEEKKKTCIFSFFWGGKIKTPALILLFFLGGKIKTPAYILPLPKGGGGLRRGREFLLLYWKQCGK